MQAGHYQNQYSFELDVQRLVTAMHDDHVQLDLGVLGPFVFGAPFAISSASVDGVQPPKVYILGMFFFLFILPFPSFIGARDKSKVLTTPS